MGANSNVYFVSVNCRLEMRRASDFMYLMAGLLEDYPVSKLPLINILDQMHKLKTREEVVEFYNRLGDDYDYRIDYIYSADSVPIYSVTRS